MRRTVRTWMRHGLALAGVPALILAATATAAQAQQAQALTFEGDTALLTVAIKPDKTADFEQIMGRLRDALLKSEKPERKQQAAGWKLIKLKQAMPDGTIAYIHQIQPVVAGADYSIMQILYDAFPDERQALYDLYRGAFAKNLSLVAGSVAVDLSKAAQ